MKKRITLGRTDKADFPELDLFELDIKMDTGAYTSSIHCHHIKEKKVDGKKTVYFELLDPSHEQYNQKKFKSTKYKYKKVKNSFGQSEKRIVIETTIVLFDKTYDIELTLSQRGEMKYPVLIGRKLLTGNFVVDTAKKNVSFRLKSEKTKRKK